MDSRILALYPEFKIVFGPYRRKDGRSVYILSDGLRKRSGRTVAQINLELKLGRRLVGDETADHIDGNKRNDAPSNLQVLSRASNTSKMRSKQRPY